MNAILTFLSRLPACRRLLAHQGGMATVEFSLILPILVVLWIGGVEVTSALSVDRRLNNLASALGDLSARSKILTHGDIDSILDIGPKAMYPYSGTGLSMRVTAVNIDSSQNAKVAWSRARGTGAYPALTRDTPMNSTVPATLRVKDSQVIMAEVWFPYTPAVGYVMVGTRTLNDRMFFVPRLVQHVKLCDNNKQNCLS
jgi:Flp pilus assembly protein TadG